MIHTRFRDSRLQKFASTFLPTLSLSLLLLASNKRRDDGDGIDGFRCIICAAYWPLLMRGSIYFHRSCLTSSKIIIQVKD
mmetsp:Transcript_2068/g.3289  ORF Transcript_2068/g.3289 Transcript_2068/m.3289 type:complete len:80 (-) Transcript_2068:212-451(-)